MCDENIEIGVTEITNNILVSAQPTDQIIDINVLETTENVELTITPSVVEVNIDVTQELITEVVTVDANTCVNIVDVTVTDATDNVTLNITPSLVEVNINRGQNNLSIEEYDSFANLPTIGNVDTYYITLDANKFWRWDAINEVYVEISSADDRIPYLGAIKNANLGEWGIKTNWLGLDTTPTNPPTAVGTLTWNDVDGTADLKLKGGNVTLQIGQENVVRVVNKTGATLNEADFRAVRIRLVSEGGAQGQRLAVLLAQGNNDHDSATTIGLVTETIANNQEGFITISGNVSEINTTGAKSWAGSETWVDGDILYLSPDHAGYLTNVKPVAPQHLVVIGYVVYAHANHGKIFVKVDNGYELDELHNVLITSPTNNQGLVYDSSLSVWKNASIQLPLSTTSPLSIASNVLSITKADATTDGYLSSADWNYFSAKQQPLSGTGFVKATGSVISYDNTVYTPQSRTLTINGTTYDLSADRSWSISVGSGMRNVSSFVATSGQTTFTIVGGYTAGLVDVFVNGTRLNAGDYTATNGTTVVLGTGVVANDIVDIINYTASLTSGITGSGTANYIPKWSSSSNLTNSLIYDNGTNIGINTITASALFHVYYSSIGTTYNDIALFGRSGGRGLFIGSSQYGFSLNDSANRGGWGIDSDNDSGFMRFYYGASEKMRIQSNGYVGIGLSYAAYKLDVAGDINITGSFRINGVAITSGGGGIITGSGTANYIPKWSGTSAITNSLIFDNGSSIGIGTTTPDIYSNIGTGLGVTMLASATNTSANLNIIGNGSGFGGISLGNSTIRRAGIFALDGSDLAFYTNASNSGTSLTERFRILSNGRIGINTSTPSYALHIKGTSGTGARLIQIDGTGTAYNIMSIVNDGCQLFLSAEGNTGGNIATGSIAYAGIIDTNTNTALQFATFATVRMTITNSGNVGIGTTSPGGKLVVVGASSNTYIAIDNVGSGENYFGANSFHNFQTAGVERMRISSAGKVGIGTSNPTEKLNIYTNELIWGINIQHAYTAGNQYYIQFQNSSGGQTGSIMGNGSSTSYNTTSDYRLKEDLKPIKGLEQVSKINVYDFKFKNSSNRMDGVLAHELQEVLPFAVTGIKDGKDMQSVDYSKIVPVLVQAIKELNAKLEAK